MLLLVSLLLQNYIVHQTARNLYCIIISYAFTNQGQAGIKWILCNHLCTLTVQ